MKILKFETKKGKFVLVDFIPAKNGGLKIENTIYSKLICQLNKVNESQASEVINSYDDRSIKSSVVALHNTLLHKGIYLFKNPITKPRWDSEQPSEYPHDYQKSVDQYNEAEEKTFYNPYIYKL